MLAWGLTATVADVPWQVIAYGRRVAPILRGLDRAIDAQATAAVRGRGNQFLRGDHPARRSAILLRERKSEASSVAVDMRLQRMMGHLPALIHPAPRSVLVVGFGAGVTAGSFVPYPEVLRIVDV